MNRIGEFFLVSSPGETEWNKSLRRAFNQIALAWPYDWVIGFILELILKTMVESTVLSYQNQKDNGIGLGKTENDNNNSKIL